MDKCPHCGGVSGFQFKVLLTAERYATWQGEEYEIDRMEILRQTNHRCSDCGKRVKRPAPTAEAHHEK